MSKAFIQALQKRRAEQKTKLDAVLETPTKEGRDLNDEERGRFDAIEKEVREIDARIAELDDQIRADEKAAATQKRYDLAQPGEGVRSEPATYENGNRHSYFLDLVRDQLNRGDGDGGVQAARERLNRHRAEIDTSMAKREAARSTRAKAELRGIDRGSVFEKRNNPRRSRSFRAGVSHLPA